MKTIFWTSYLEHNNIPELDLKNPENSLISFNKILPDLDIHQDFKICPAFRDQFKNTYSLSFPFDYNLYFDKEKIYSPDKDQNFFNDLIYIRSLKNHFYSINIRYIFFCEDDLLMSMEPAYFTENSFTCNANLIPGKFNIGKWFRPLDCAFFLKKNSSALEIKKDDIFSYIKFHTDDDLEFKRFIRSENIKKLLEEIYSMRKQREQKIVPLSFFYSYFEKIKIKNKILTEIRNNLI
jgi:hypothetical protein